MQGIYDVVNNYHLMEGLDSEFLVIADSEADAKVKCLQMLAEDQDMHIQELKKNIEDLEKSLQKSWNQEAQQDPKYAFMAKVNERSKENIVRYQKLLAEFHGYKEDALTVKKINSRLKNGYIQFEDEMGSVKKW